MSPEWNQLLLPNPIADYIGPCIDKFKPLEGDNFDNHRGELAADIIGFWEWESNLLAIEGQCWFDTSTTASVLIAVFRSDTTERILLALQEEKMFVKDQAVLIESTLDTKDSTIRIIDLKGTEANDQTDQGDWISLVHTWGDLDENWLNRISRGKIQEKEARDLIDSWSYDIL